MEDSAAYRQITSLEDVDKEIEAVKQRIKLKEADLANDFKTAPNQLFSLAVSPLSSAVSSFVGGRILLKVAGAAKNFIAGSTHKKNSDTEETSSGTKSFILNSVKKISFISLLKLGAWVIRRI